MMATIKGYDYFEGSTRVQLETPKPIVGSCEACNGMGECHCCGRECRECNGVGDGEYDEISVSVLRERFPEVYEEMRDAIQAIDRQKALLKKRYGSQWRILESLRDFWERTS